VAQMTDVAIWMGARGVAARVVVPWYPGALCLSFPSLLSESSSKAEHSCFAPGHLALFRNLLALTWCVVPLVCCLGPMTSICMF
jgi:hypothetical protein